MSTTSRRNVVYNNSRNNLDNGSHHRSGVGVGRIQSSPPPPPPPPPPLPLKIYATSSTTNRRNIYSQNSDNEVGIGFDIPQAFADDEHISSRRPQIMSRRLGSTPNKSRSWMIPFGLLMVFVLVAGYFLLPQYERKILDKHSIEQDRILREQEIDLSIQFDSKIAELKKENAELHKRIVNEKELKILNQQLIDEKKRLEFQIKDGKGLHKDGGIHAKQLEQRYEKEIEKLNQSNGHLTTYRKKMQENIQLMSKTDLLERHGHGPHLIEIVVQFDSHKGFNDQGVFTVRMAPLEEMPHSVYWFLEQVQRKLYDGCSFHRNAGHVVQAGPAPNFLSPPNPQLNKRFKDAGFDSILFQEYSKKFPHEKFTLGYAGELTLLTEYLFWNWNVCLLLFFSFFFVLIFMYFWYKLICNK